MLRAIAQTLLGLVLAATPVVLWVAWTPALFVATLASCLLSAALLVVLTEPTARDAADGVRLPEAFLDEAQGLHPMIYHHSGRRSSRFQRAMGRLARLTPPAN